MSAMSRRLTWNATLEDSAAAPIQAVEAAGHPYQDNTTVLLYATQADWDAG